MIESSYSLSLQLILQKRTVYAYEPSHHGWTEISIIGWKNHPPPVFEPRTSNSTVCRFTICAISPHISTWLDMIEEKWREIEQKQERRYFGHPKVVSTISAARLVVNVKRHTKIIIVGVKISIGVVSIDLICSQKVPFHAMEYINLI